MQHILYMVESCNLPFQFVESDGFRSLMKVIQPRYVVPFRNTLKKRLLEQYDVLFQIMKHKIANIPALCLTTDIWTCSYTNESYLGITVHYIVKEQHKMQSLVLATEVLNSAHTCMYKFKLLLVIITL